MQSKANAQDVIRESYDHMTRMAIYLDYARQVEYNHTTHRPDALTNDLFALERATYDVMCLMHKALTSWFDYEPGATITTITRSIIAEHERTDYAKYKNSRTFSLLKKYSELLLNMIDIYGDMAMM